MAIGVNSNVSSGDLSAPGATFNVSLPSSTAATDILVLVIGATNSGGLAGSWTAPAGWTAIWTSFALGNGPGTRLQGWWALGNIANLTFTKSGTVTSAGWEMVGFTGVNNTTPIDATGATASASSTSVVASAVTVVTANAWEVIGCADGNPGNLTAPGFVAKENGAPPTNQSACVLYNTTPKAAGSTGTVTVTSDGSSVNQHVLAASFAIRPAAAQVWPYLDDSLCGGMYGMGMGV